MLASSREGWRQNAAGCPHPALRSILRFVATPKCPPICFPPIRRGRIHPAREVCGAVGFPGRRGRRPLRMGFGPLRPHNARQYVFPPFVGAGFIRPGRFVVPWGSRGVEDAAPYGWGLARYAPTMPANMFPLMRRGRIHPDRGASRRRKAPGREESRPYAWLFGLSPTHKAHNRVCHIRRAGNIRPSRAHSPAANVHGRAMPAPTVLGETPQPFPYASPCPTGSSASRQYPTRCTVRMRCSQPSLRRRRWMWVSRVRVPSRVGARASSSPQTCSYR